MNLALSTLVVFILLLPGIFFRRFYYSEEFSREYFKQTFFEVFLSTLIPALFFQLFWYFTTRSIGLKPDLTVIGNLLGTKPSTASFQNIEENAWGILLYHTSMLIAALVSGHYLKQLVRVKKWDRRYTQFRFQNSWHYKLKGEFFDFPRAAFDLEQDTVEDIELVYVDALVQTGEGTIIYDGLLVDYDLSGDGGLDTIILKEVQRRYLKDDTSREQDRYYSVPGHIMVLKYVDIINLNFSYYKMARTEEGKLDVQLVQ